MFFIVYWGHMKLWILAILICIGCTVYYFLSVSIVQTQFVLPQIIVSDVKVAGYFTIENNSFDDLEEVIVELPQVKQGTWSIPGFTGGTYSEETQQIMIGHVAHKTKKTIPVHLTLGGRPGFAQDIFVQVTSKKGREPWNDHIQTHVRIQDSLVTTAIHSSSTVHTGEITNFTFDFVYQTVPIGVSSKRIGVVEVPDTFMVTSSTIPVVKHRGKVPLKETTHVILEGFFETNARGTYSATSTVASLNHPEIIEREYTQTIKVTPQRLSLDIVNLPSAVSPEEQYSFTAVIENTEPFLVEDGVLTFAYGNQTVIKKGITLDPHEKKAIPITVTLEKAKVLNQKIPLRVQLTLHADGEIYTSGPMTIPWITPVSISVKEKKDMIEYVMMPRDHDVALTLVYTLGENELFQGFGQIPGGDVHFDTDMKKITVHIPRAEKGKKANIQCSIARAKGKKLAGEGSITMIDSETQAVQTIPITSL